MNLQVVTEQELDTSFFAQPNLNLATLPSFLRAALERSKVGRAAISYAEAHAGTFVGFEQSEEAPVRRHIPAGFRRCADCYNRALANGHTEENAHEAAVQAEDNFARIGTKPDGSPKYGSYCKADQKIRAAKYADSVRDRQRLRAIVSTYLPNAQARVVELEAEREALSVKYPNVLTVEMPDEEFTEAVEVL